MAKKTKRTVKSIKTKPRIAKRKRKLSACSVCGNPGHNSRTCGRT
jgi:hypothetical protein